MEVSGCRHIPVSIIVPHSVTADVLYVATCNPVSLYSMKERGETIQCMELYDIFPRTISGVWQPFVTVAPLGSPLDGQVVLHEEQVGTRITRDDHVTFNDLPAKILMENVATGSILLKVPRGVFILNKDHIFSPRHFKEKKKINRAGGVGGVTGAHAVTHWEKIQIHFREQTEGSPKCVSKIYPGCQTDSAVT